eukprot:Skav207518  [mRNA]  locus=scaffold907:211849:214685:+ [translate_table: standard]
MCEPFCPVGARWGLAQVRAFSLLEQLPDYTAGSKALADGQTFGCTFRVGVAEIGTDGWPREFAVMMQLNRFAGTDGGASDALKAIQSELDAMDSSDPSSELMLRCTLGELAVTAGHSDDWVRETLVKTLKDFDQLQPKDPSGRHAEKRAPEIKRLREAAGAPMDASKKCWASLVLPQPLASKVRLSF